MIDAASEHPRAARLVLQLNIAVSMWEILKGGGYYITVPMTTICGPSQQPVDTFCCGTRPHNIRWWVRTIAVVIHVANTLRWTHSHDETCCHPYNSRHDMHFASDMT